MALDYPVDPKSVNPGSLGETVGRDGEEVGVSKLGGSSGVLFSCLVLGLGSHRHFRRARC